MSNAALALSAKSTPFPAKIELRTTIWHFTPFTPAQPPAVALAFAVKVQLAISVRPSVEECSIITAAPFAPSVWLPRKRQFSTLFNALMPDARTVP